MVRIKDGSKIPISPDSPAHPLPVDMPCVIPSPDVRGLGNMSGESLLGLVYVIHDSILAHWERGICPDGLKEGSTLSHCELPMGATGSDWREASKS